MAAPDFSVTIIYESVEAGKRAKRFSDQLIAEAAVDGALELNLWNFGVLGIPAVRNVAASTAATSDLVILSMSGTVPLPAQTVEWVEMWTWLIDGRKPAVIALFGSWHPACAAIRTYLRGSAVSKKLDFFPIVSDSAADVKPDATLPNGHLPDVDEAPGRRKPHALPLLSKARSRLNGSGEPRCEHPPLSVMKRARSSGSKPPN